MSEKELTSIQIDFEARDDLRALAEADYRSMPAEIRWLIACERARRTYMATIPLIGTISEDGIKLNKDVK
jgi:hypothetical protein